MKLTPIIVWCLFGAILGVAATTMCCNSGTSETATPMGPDSKSAKRTIAWLVRMYQPYFSAPRENAAALQAAWDSFGKAVAYRHGVSVRWTVQVTKVTRTSPNGWRIYPAWIRSADASMDIITPITVQGMPDWLIRLKAGDEIEIAGSILRFSAGEYARHFTVEFKEITVR